MRLRILLADDSMTAQNLGKKILTEAGYDVVTVSNGVAADKKIAELHPDIVLLDVYMPGYTGVEVCEKTKAAPQTAQIPVVLTVGKMEPFLPEEGTKVKADGLIIKPFEAGELITVVGRLARSVYPPEPAVPSRVVVPECGPPTSHPSKSTTAEFRMSNEIAEAVQARSEQTPPEPPVAEGTACSQPTPEVPGPGHGSGPAAKGDTGPSPFSRQQGGEICDVCGYVNGEHALVCQQCDVPLPSSVMSFRVTASRTTADDRSRSGRK